MFIQLREFTYIRFLSKINTQKNGDDNSREVLFRLRPRLLFLASFSFVFTIAASGTSSGYTLFIFILSPKVTIDLSW